MLSNKSPQNLTYTNEHLLPHYSWGQASGHGLGGIDPQAQDLSTRPQFSCWPGLWFHLKAQLEENQLPSSLMWLLAEDVPPRLSDPRPQVFAGCWLMVPLGALPYRPLHKAAGKVASQREEKRAATVYGNLTSEATIYCFSYTLVVMGKSVGAAHA